MNLSAKIASLESDIEADKIELVKAVSAKERRFLTELIDAQEVALYNYERRQIGESSQGDNFCCCNIYLSRAYSSFPLLTRFERLLQAAQRRALVFVWRHLAPE